jgi:hypothetical protein
MKKLKIMLGFIAAFALFALPAMAKPSMGDEHNEGPAGMSNRLRYNLSVYPGVDAEEAWGRVVFNAIGEKFHLVLNAHGLKPDTDYLIRSKGKEVGMGTTNEYGDLNINASWECDGETSISGRINLWEKEPNIRTLLTGQETVDVFGCYPDL